MNGSQAPRSLGWLGISVSAIVAVALMAGAYGWQRAGSPPAAAGTFTIAMTDYRFSPANMVWRVGERVTITLSGKPEDVPPKAHEFILGRTPRTTTTAFGLRSEEHTSELQSLKRTSQSGFCMQKQMKHKIKYNHTTM